jgi:hypothetical protein
MVQTQSAASAPGQQNPNPQQLRWRNALTPGNQQGAVAQGGSSSTSTSGLGVGAGAGAYGVSARVYAEVLPILIGI